MTTRTRPSLLELIDRVIAALFPEQTYDEERSADHLTRRGKFSGCARPELMRARLGVCIRV